jgi:multidrug resistance efflux pump
MKMRTVILGMIPTLLGCSARDVDSDPSKQFVATAVGRLDAQNEARRLVAAQDGVIASIDVQRGQRVRQGEILARVDCRALDASVRAAQAQLREQAARTALVHQGPREEDRRRASANLESASIALSDAEDKYRRAQGLAERDFVTQRDLVRLQADRDEAKAVSRARQSELDAMRNGARAEERKAAEASLQATEAAASKAAAIADQCAVRSPIDAEVLQILRQPGEFSGASQGEPLIVVGDVGPMIVRAQVHERDVEFVRLGQPVEIWDDWSRPHWKGSVTGMAGIMGRRTARSLDPTDRFDRDVREVFIAIASPAPPSLVGLRVTVGFRK